MIIVLFVIFLLMIIIGFVLSEKADCDSILEFFGIGGVVIGCIAECVVLFFIILLCFDVSKSKVIDKKIKMFQEENKLIEEQVTTVVNTYKDYEKEVISNTGQMATILIKFPELKSNELVKKQIDVYLKNNDKIKSLKEEKIDYQVSKWWLYFGE